MQSTSDYDLSSLNIRLSELKSQFDKSMREGETFQNIKDIHLQIKELECHLKALDWDADLHANTDNIISRRERHAGQMRGVNHNRYRHIQEPPPLL